MTAPPRTASELYRRTRKAVCALTSSTSPVRQVRSIPDDRLSPYHAGSRWDGETRTVEIARKGVARDLRKLLDTGQEGDIASSRIEAVRMRSAFATLIRGELAAIAESRNGRKTLPSRPGEATFREGLVQELAWELTNDVASMTACDTLHRELTGVVHAGGKRVAGAAARALCQQIAEQRSLLYRDVLVRILAAPDGDLLHACAELAVPGEVASRELLVEGTAAVMAAALAYEEYRTVGLNTRLADAYGAMLGSTAARRSARLMHEWKLLSAQAGTPVPDIGPLPGRKRAVVDPRLGLVPMTDITVETLLTCAPLWTEEVLGGTSYVRNVSVVTGLRNKGRPVHGLFWFGAGEKSGLLEVDHDAVLVPLQKLASWCQESSAATVPQDAWHDLVAMRSALRILFHEEIHAVGPKARGRMAKDWHAVFPGARALREGLTELASSTFLDSFLAASGLAARMPELLEVPNSEVYVGETTMAAVLVEEAARRTGQEAQELLRTLVQSGGADIPLEILAAAYVSSFDHSRVAVGSTAQGLVRMALEQELGRLDSMLHTASTSEELVELGRTCGWSAIRKIDLLLASCARSGTAMPERDEAADVSGVA